MLQQFLILSDLTVFSAERQVRKEKTADYKPFGTVEKTAVNPFQ